MPLSDEALTHTRYDSAAGDSPRVLAPRADPTRELPSSRDVPYLSTTRVVTAAGTAFVVVFLISFVIAVTLRGAGWEAALASGISLGIVGAGLQMMLCAVRHRREIEESSST